MGRAPSQDLRERVMAAVESGTGAYAAASVFRISVFYIYKVLGRREKTGKTSARPWAGGPKPKLAGYDKTLRVHVTRKPDATLAELQAWLMAEHNVKVSIGCLWNRLRQRGLTLKKSPCAPPNRTARISPRPATNGAGQPDRNPERLVFMEETGAKTHMVRLSGRAPRGQRLVAPTRMAIG